MERGKSHQRDHHRCRLFAFKLIYDDKRQTDFNVIKQPEAALEWNFVPQSRQPSSPSTSSFCVFRDTK